MCDEDWLLARPWTADDHHDTVGNLRKIRAALRWNASSIQFFPLIPHDDQFGGSFFQELSEFARDSSFLDVAMWIDALFRRESPYTDVMFLRTVGNEGVGDGDEFMRTHMHDFSVVCTKGKKRNRVNQLVTQSMQITNRITRTFCFIEDVDTTHHSFPSRALVYKHMNFTLM
jgi:hypothetical protein